MTITVEEVRDYLAPFPDNDARRRDIEDEADDVRAVYRNDPLHSRLKVVFSVAGGAFVFTPSINQSAWWITEAGAHERSLLP